MTPDSIKHAIRENPLIAAGVIIFVVLIGAFYGISQSVGKTAATKVRNSQVEACIKVNNPNRVISAKNARITKGFMGKFSELVNSLASVRTGQERKRTLDIALYAQQQSNKIQPLIIPNCEELFPKP